MKITDMPADVLGSIMSAAGQPARVQSMVACKALHGAATGQGVWDSIVFGDLDKSAVQFLLRHRCPKVTVKSVTPDDIAWFLGRVADLGGGDCIRDLRLDIGRVQRMPEDLLCAVARHSALRHFSMFIDDCEMTCEMVWPRTAQLHELRTMTIVETGVDAKSVVVWFSGSQSRFPALEDLTLDVGLSDVMAGLCHMPRLRRLVYHFDTEEGGETYEDACMVGADLDVLEIDLNDESDTRHLFRQMEQCAVRRLVLHTHVEGVDVVHPLSPSIEELVFGMHCTYADVTIDFPYLAEYAALRLVQLEVMCPEILQSEMGDCRHCLTFEHGSLRDCMKLFSRVRLNVLPSTRVAFSPV